MSRDKVKYGTGEEVLMKIANCKDIEPLRAEDIGITGANALLFRFLIHRGDGAPNFSMMLLELAPGGNTPQHCHGWEEEIFVKSGKGEIETAGGRNSLGPGDFLYIGPDEKHQFLNTGDESLEMICLVPHSSD